MPCEFTFSVFHRKAGRFGTYRRRVILLSCLTWARQAGGPARVTSVQRKNTADPDTELTPIGKMTVSITQPLERGLFCSQARETQEDLTQLDIELARAVEKMVNVALCFDCSDRQRGP